jgi:hypothetical protein
MDIEIIAARRCMATIYKDRTLTRTGAYDIRESGQSQYCTADAFTDLCLFPPPGVGHVRPFHA